MGIIYTYLSTYLIAFRALFIYVGEGRGRVEGKFGASSPSSFGLADPLGHLEASQTAEITEKAVLTVLTRLRAPRYQVGTFISHSYYVLGRSRYR